MFYGQPEQTEFADQLVAELRSGNWRRIEIAVAWVRRSGVGQVEEAVAKYLATDGALRITVGVDFQNTTYEGLAGLLAWEQLGDFEAHVNHDENLNTTFHPKVYLFSDGVNARVYVG